MTTNKELSARREKAVTNGVKSAYPVFIQSAQNSEMWDVEGKRYIDFGGGIAVLNTGHTHPDIIAAAKAQIDLFTHTCFQVTQYEAYVALAEKLNELAPVKGPAKTLFVSTGAEALENAVKVARAATSRSGVIAFSGGYHGRTMMTLALTGKVLPYKNSFSPMPGEVFHIPFPFEPYGITLQDSLKALDRVFKSDIHPSRVACIVIEPVQGEGGFLPASAELMQALRKICDEHGILLVADEVQSGFGRTGKLYATEHYRVKADLLTTAKSLAGGFPIAAVVGTAALMDAPLPGGLGGTYAGSPIACAAALAVLEVIKKENLLEKADKIGKRLKEKLGEIETDPEAAPIGVIRGPGAMVAFDIVKKRGTVEPDAETTAKVLQYCQQHGLILLACGLYANTIRLLMPLTIEDSVLEEGLAILHAALKAARV